MIVDIARNEITLYARSRVFISLAFALVVLLVAATLVSNQRLETFERERVSAAEEDRDVWLNQGEQDLHSAAHFSRYAFKPIPSLVAFDPGVVDYSGLALWMEAHFQHPAVFRRAEDIGDARSFADLSPAWILQYIVPLIFALVLFASVAGERESGTFRQVTATGAGVKALVGGKFLGASLALGAVTLPALALNLLFSQSGTVDVLSDRGVRIAGLVLVYLVYFVAIACVAIGVSALCRDRKTALTVLVSLWVVCFLVVPRLTVGTTSLLLPTPEAQTITTALQAASDAWWYSDDETQEAFEAGVLQEYGVNSVDDLPINYLAYKLQYSEEDAIIGFNKIYGELEARYRDQERALGVASLVSPVLAVSVLSSGLSGTDRIHHQAFADAAEAHRRVIVKQLNDNLMYNAEPGGGRPSYSVGREMWSKIADFEHTPPRFGSVFSNYVASLLVLLLYLVGGVGFAIFAMRRARKRVAL